MAAVSVSIPNDMLSKALVGALQSLKTDSDITITFATLKPEVSAPISKLFYIIIHI